MPTRVYEKGERRYKHVGNRPEPEIEFVPGNPRMCIGKCPNNLGDADRFRLLNEAIPGSNGDREISVLKKLYVVHEGAIYEAQTSDQGRSYHGYPYRGKLTRRIIRALRDMAIDKHCVRAFDDWVKQHIEAHGA